MSDQAAPSSTKLRPLAALLPYLWIYRGRTAAALAALTLAALTTLSIPLALRQMIDVGFSNADGAFVNRAFAVMIVLALLLALASSARYYLVITLGERIVADLRRDLFQHIMLLSPAFFDTARSGEIISRLTADATQIKSAVGASASIALRNLVLFLGATVMMVATSPRLSALVVVAIPFIVLPLVGLGRRVRQRSRAAQDMLAEASADATELIGALRTVQASVYETMAATRFGSGVEAAYRAARDATSTRAVLTAIAIFLVFGSVVGVLWWGAQEVLAGNMSPGRLGQFVLYSVFAAGALGELSQVWGEVSQAAGATERIVELIHSRPEIETPANPVPMPVPPRGAIRFDRVAFAYVKSGDAVISDLSLSIEPGERVAIVGPSGAGKSTLISLLLRFYDPESGTVQIDGIDIRQADPRAVRSRTALVPQDPVIFAATALENIRFATRDATPQAVEQAAVAAHADDFIGELPNGYHTVLGERGVTLSGGQRQRIAIARAILKDAPILLLDEATSALDALNEALVQQALERLMKGRTSLVIAHRLATVKGADRIIVMDRGRIVETGTHHELTEAGGIYARLANLQFMISEPT